MDDRQELDPDERERPPICPACGVTNNLVGAHETARFVCLECGFSDENGDDAVRRA